MEAVATLGQCKSIAALLEGCAQESLYAGGKWQMELLSGSDMGQTSYLTSTVPFQNSAKKEYWAMSQFD